MASTRTIAIEAPDYQKRIRLAELGHQLPLARQPEERRHARQHDHEDPETVLGDGRGTTMDQATYQGCIVGPRKTTASRVNPIARIVPAPRARNSRRTLMTAAITAATSRDPLRRMSWWLPRPSSSPELGQGQADGRGGIEPGQHRPGIVEGGHPAPPEPDHLRHGGHGGHGHRGCHQRRPDPRPQRDIVAQPLPADIDDADEGRDLHHRADRAEERFRDLGGRLGRTTAQPTRNRA